MTRNTDIMSGETFPSFLCFTMRTYLFDIVLMMGSLNVIPHSWIVYIEIHRHLCILAVRYN